MIVPRTNCPICFDDSDAMVVLHRAPGSTAGAPRIPHAFHAECIQRHFSFELGRLRNGDDKPQLNCPTCRVSLIPNEASLNGALSVSQKVKSIIIKFLREASIDEPPVPLFYLFGSWILGFPQMLIETHAWENTSLTDDLLVNDQINLIRTGLALFFLIAVNTNHIEKKIFVFTLLNLLGTQSTQFVFQLFHQSFNFITSECPILKTTLELYVLSTFVAAWLQLNFLAQLYNRIERTERNLYDEALSAATKTGDFEPYFIEAPHRGVPI
jgi:hypothetical protein